MAVNKEVEIHAKAERIKELKIELEGEGMSCKIIIENLQHEVDKEQPSARGRAGGFDTKYHRLGEVRNGDRKNDFHLIFERKQTDWKFTPHKRFPSQKREQMD